MGTKTPEQLADNLRASQLELSADELKTLNDTSALPLARIKPPSKK